MRKDALAFLLLILTSPILWASPYGFKKNNFSTFFETSYLFTNSNYDDGGSTARLPLSNQLTEVKVDLNPTYDFTNRWGAYGDFSFKKMDSYGTTVARTNSNLSDTVFGTQFQLPVKFANIIPDFSISLPTYPKPGSDDSVLMGDGGIVTTAKLYITKTMYSFSLGGFGGVSGRTEGLSTLIPWGVMAKYEYDPIFYELMFHGASSINNDQYTNNPQARRRITDIVDSGSLLYDSVNPSWGKIQGHVGWKIDPRIHLTFGIEYVAFGVRTAQSTSFMVGLSLLDILNSARKQPKENKGFIPLNPDDAQ
jgi:hypothetical protein